VARDPIHRGDADESGAADYRWEQSASGSGLGALTAEQWLRRVWEGAPTGQRAFLRFGWRFGLGLRLGPADPLHVLGWHIDANTDRTVVVSASSRILTATNALTVEDASIRWRTDVRYRNCVGRLVWFPAAFLHQRIVPWSVRRTTRSLN
jgi:hypothetical protein